MNPDRLATRCDPCRGRSQLARRPGGLRCAATSGYPLAALWAALLAVWCFPGPWTLHLGPSAAAAATPPRPNIVFILADDLGYGEIGCYGQKIIETPRVDRMAREGMRFTQFYAGATVCAPSRSVLMTGQHHGHTRVRGNAGKANPLAQSLRSNDVTVAKVLQTAGYKTALIGKWGLGDVGVAEQGLPRRHGFDYFFGYLNQHHAHNHYPDHLWRNEEKVPLPNDPCRWAIRVAVTRATRRSMPTICLPKKP
jgi:arylsulfatase A-like enzyme